MSLGTIGTKLLQEAKEKLKAAMVALKDEFTNADNQVEVHAAFTQFNDEMEDHAETIGFGDALEIARKAAQAPALVDDGQSAPPVATEALPDTPEPAQDNQEQATKEKETLGEKIEGEAEKVLDAVGEVAGEAKFGQ